MKKTKAGRPRKPISEKKIAKNITLHPALVEWMDKQPGSRSALIEKAMKKTYNLKF